MRHFARAMGPRMRTRECDRAPFIDTSRRLGHAEGRLRTVDAAEHGGLRASSVQDISVRLFRLVASQDEIGPALDAMVLSAPEPVASPRRSRGVWRRHVRDPHSRSRRRGLSLGPPARLWVITIEGRIEGVLLGFLDHGVLHYLQKGFNSTFAKDDRTVLLALSVKSCVEDPAIKAFDLMGGGAAYKGMWARSATVNVVNEMTRASWRGRLLASGRVFQRLPDGLSGLDAQLVAEPPTGLDSQAAAGPRTAGGRLRRGDLPGPCPPSCSWPPRRGLGVAGSRSPADGRLHVDRLAVGEELRRERPVRASRCSSPLSRRTGCGTRRPPTAG